MDPFLVGHTVYRALNDGRIAPASKLNPQSLPDPPAIVPSWGLSADSGRVQSAILFAESSSASLNSRG